MSNQLVEINTELSEIESQRSSVMAILSTEKGLDDHVQAVIDKVESFVHDLSTGVGRAKTKTFASDIGKMKTAWDGFGKDATAEMKAATGRIDKSRRKMRVAMDEQKVRARQPVTDWEAEQAAIKVRELADIEANRLAAEIASCQELGEVMNREYDRNLADAAAKVAADKLVEDARIEAERIENNQRIAKQAKADAELAAKKLIDDANTARQKAIDDKILAHKELAESDARAKRIKEQRDIKDQWLAIENDAYGDHAEFERIAANAAFEARQVVAVEAARQQEIQRQDNEEQAARAAQAKKEKNKIHVSQIRSQIGRQIMIDTGVDKDTAKKIVRSIIAMNKLLTINY